MTEDKLVQIMSEFTGMPLRDVAFYTLRKGILHGYLKPGERLMEIQMANRLGVSRTPVREAIRMLELEGLVINNPHKGAQVARITEKDLQDVLEVRKGLEEIAVKLACERITPEELDALYIASREFAQRASNSDDILHVAEADEEYHAIIYEASRNHRLVQLISNLSDQMFRYRIEYLKDEANRQSLIKEHDDLWQSLKNHDFSRAKKHIQQHIERQMDAVLQRIEEE